MTATTDRYPTAWLAWANEKPTTGDWRDWIAALGTSAASDWRASDEPLYGLCLRIEQLGRDRSQTTAVADEARALSDDVLTAVCAIERFAVLVGYVLGRTAPASPEAMGEWFAQARALLQPETWQP